MELREKIKERRNNLKPEYIEKYSVQASRALYKYLRHDLLWEKDIPVLCYYPLHNEVDLRPLYVELLEEDVKLYFPVTEGENMTFYQVESLDDFVEGTFHVMEPKNREYPLTDLAQSMIALVPGVMFDVSGNRVGYGKGYYDRYLKGCADCHKIGIAYPMQILGQWEAKPWDVPMDCLLPDMMEETHD
jgi:5-formyltetrahydrofolate cyclo-ligase